MGANNGTAFGHDITNYTIGKGIVSIKLLGEPAFIDCGNVPTFEFLPKPTVLAHYSSRTGVATKDFTAVTKTEGTLTIVLEELSARNMALALMGTMIDSPSPIDDFTINILQEGIINGAVQFVSENSIGPQWTWTFPSVNFTPNKAIALISDGWASMDITGDVLAVNGIFGTAKAVMRDAPGP